jgi:hypothetical protein
MNLNNELHQLTGRAEAYLKYQDDLTRAEDLQGRLEQSEGRRRPAAFKGVVFHGEGLETIAGGRVDITPSFTLPAREVSWDFAGGSYEIEVRLSSPGTLTLSSLSGAPFVENRRVTRVARLDIRRGGVVLSATSPIESIRIWRFEKRYPGSVLFGPFDVSGIISARVIGHGTWQADVASDYVMPGQFKAEDGRMVFAREGSAIWRGRGPEAEGMPVPRKGANYRQIALTGAPPEPLKFHPQVESGRVATGHERITLEAPTEVPFDSSVSYWALPGRWKRLSSLQAGPRPVYQTHVWGSVEGAGRIFDARTGKEVASGAAPGQYVAQSSELSSVSITGSYAAQGEPVRLRADPRALTVAARPAGEGKAVLPTGSYDKVTYAENPVGVYVRIRGRGQARSLELTVQSSEGSPTGHIIERTRRISLAPFFDAQSESIPAAAFAAEDGIVLPASL